MKKRMTLMALLLFLIGGDFQFSGNVMASELSFGVQTIIPENQIDQSKSYFELRVSPGQTQDLEVTLRNDTDKEVIVLPSVNSAFTNMNGVVEYGEKDGPIDETLVYNMKDLIQVDKEIAIPANSSTILKLHLTVPDTDFLGVLAGGLTLIEKPDEEKEVAETGGLAIENEYAYVVGIVLKESDDPVAPELQLNDVFATQINARNAIKSNLQNTAPIYISQLTVTTLISKKNSDKILYTATKDNMQMAPNSSFDFPTSLEGEKLESGEYTIVIDAEAGEDSWHFQKDFTIDSDEAKKFNASDVSIVADNTWMYIVGGVAGGVLIMLALFLLFDKRRNRRR